MPEDQIDAFRRHLTELERSRNTIDAYIWSVRFFFCRYQEVKKENMLDFKQWLLENRKPSTANQRIIAMNQFCRFLGCTEYCVKGFKVHQGASVENVISFSEYQRLIRGLQKDGNERGYWMVRFLAHTGARVSEFVRLDRDGLEKGYCEMWTKGKVRRIYIPELLIRESRLYFQQHFRKVDTDLLFANQKGNQLTSRGVSENIRRWARRYGIRMDAAHPHAFRHLFAIEFLKRNSNLALLADLLGHSNVSTTSIYLKLSREEQMRQFNQASDWQETGRRISENIRVNQDLSEYIKVNQDKSGLRRDERRQNFEQDRFYSSFYPEEEPGNDQAVSHDGTGGCPG